ncbi:MAG TPA: glycosyltransferase family 2 protein [Phycisphaerae bacterium]|nr:glycosyltransferase family 2 protein [Phycisphaerae bacterium]
MSARSSNATTHSPTRGAGSLVADGKHVLEQTLAPPADTSEHTPLPQARKLTRCSVVVPAYNEQDNLESLHARLTAVLAGTGADYEIILVDDGSADATLEVMRKLAAADPHVRFVSFARNFGHEAASTAGLDRASGDVVVLMDADLQDPPELIPELIDQWAQGHDVVYAQRRRREGESLFKRLTAWAFYRTLNAVTPTPIPADTGDFRLMDREVVGQFRRMREANRFVRGMIAWVGHRQTAVQFDRPARHAGEAKYNLFKLMALSLDAAMGFSTFPLRVATVLGLITTVGAVVAGSAVVIHKLFFGLAVEGYALLAAGIFFLGGVQMLLLGILGEYIGRIYTQVQQRPLYVVKEER